MNFTSNEKIALSVRMRPQNLNDILGQDHLIGNGKILTRLVDEDNLRSIVFFGPPGSGKSSIARAISLLTESDFISLNAVLSNVKELREKIKIGEDNKLNGKSTILFIDEIHRYNKSQQDALLPAIEESNIILIGSTTHNPNFYLTPALVSRIHLLPVKALEIQDLNSLFENALTNKESGLGNFSLDISKEVKTFIINSSAGDARKLLDNLELCFFNAVIDENGIYKLTPESAESAIQKKLLKYDKDEDNHYDYISAFIKSVRGSDPDAAIYYLARMLASGEDPRFIARRLAILAGEDIGLACPEALNIASSTLKIVEFIGMPEARIILSECTIFLSCSPKSNSAYTAIDKALQDIENGELYPPPDYLLNSPSANKQDNAENYKYPHDYPYHYVNQKYLKTDKKYYTPGELGKEKEFKKRLDWINKNL